MPWKGLRFTRDNEAELVQGKSPEHPEDIRYSEQLHRGPAQSSLLSPPTDIPLPASHSGTPAVSIGSARPSISDRPASPPIQEQTPRHRRFSMLKFRHASDSQLALRAKAQSEEAVPPVPALPDTPAIVTTSPTTDSMDRPQKLRQILRLPARLTEQTPAKSPEGLPNGKSVSEKNIGSKSRSSTTGSSRPSRVTFDQPERTVAANHNGAPPAYGDESNTSLPLPVFRLSESSRSDASSAEQVAYATTTTTHTVSTTTTFFRLPRRKKNGGHLFPLPMKVPPAPSSTASGAATPRLSTSATTPNSPTRSASIESPPTTALHRPSRESREGEEMSPLQSPSASALAATSTSFSVPAAPLMRQDSTSTRSARSIPGLRGQRRPDNRGRSSTMGSLNDHGDDASLSTTPMPTSGRTSTSTTGRSSFGGFLHLSNRIRNNSEPAFLRQYLSAGTTPGTPGSIDSKPHSLSLSRDEPVHIPEREDDDTPAKYLARLEQAVSRGVVASIMSKSNDPFSQAVLRSYMRGFAFFGDPIDMAIRKLFMEVELPKETQQIDRVLQAFADRYHECNPGIYASPDQAYFIAFSILILHTDVFNKNNKHKMQRHDYVKNTQGEGIADDILECFYDNISYTPFIHVEDDLDINGERIVAHKARRTMFMGASTDSIKKTSREPVDPYALILDNKLESLRPTLGDVMHLDDPYNYLGTAGSLDLANLQKTFFRSGVLQIVSARSRPEAFMSPMTITNPDEAHPGVVDIKVTKVGILWRKEARKKKARSPWQEWGAILTGSQLYFFRNTAWAKSLMHQYEAHHKNGHAGVPVTFKPPLEAFKPDALMSTDGAVALLDSSYKRHKHAFIFVRHGGFEETFLADSEEDLNDWLGKLNYAAAFRTAGVRMRGVVGGNYEGQRSRGIRRMDSSTSGQSVQTPTGDVSIQSGKIDTQLAQQILAARRQIMLQKVEEAEVKIAAAQKQLDGQLRNARHLQILAPIQPKTREQLVLGAGRMSAKLKWVRMEIWRMKCHKDILVLDLEEEKKTMTATQLRNLNVSSGPPLPQTSNSIKAEQGLGRLESRSSITSSPQRSTRSPTAPQQLSHRDSRETDFSMDDIFRTPPNLSRQSSNYKPTGNWELPPLTFDGQKSPSNTDSNSILTKSGEQNSNVTPFLTPTARGDVRRVSLADSSSTSATPVRMEEQPKGLFDEAGLVGLDATLSDQNNNGTTNESDKERHNRKSLELDTAEGRSRVRRSLHRTLREAHVPTPHRSRKGKDSTSSAGVTDEAKSPSEQEGLARATGSFTVHGKKASVVTFGSDWQAMSPEERLKSRKQGPDGRSASSAGLEIESPLTFAAVRRPSTTTTSSTTGKSFGFDSISYHTAMADQSNLTTSPPTEVLEDPLAPTNVTTDQLEPLPVNFPYQDDEISPAPIEAAEEAMVEQSNSSGTNHDIAAEDKDISPQPEVVKTSSAKI
ncbi:MAG: hypothetical protein M1819_000866 [Sarea resinae]|nr:MAG: hypothetical protein M1819_000866 [Sarea resinae]